jgi:hypothetical protein
VMKRLESLLLAICRTIIAGAFWVASRVFHKVEIHGVEHDSGASRTYYGMSHKRDLDPIVIVPTVVFHRGWRGLAGDVHFALRSDGFSPGYLARITMNPRGFARLIRPLNIGLALRFLGAHPIHDLYRPAEEWIRDLLSSGYNGRVGDALAPKFIEELATITGKPYEEIEAYQLSHLLDWRFQYALQHFYRPEILVGSVRRPLEQRIVSKIKEDLSELDAWLLLGGSLYGSPEGQLSPDGRLSPINSGLHRLLEAAPPDTRIVPIFIIYDFMTVQKLRIFVEFAPAIEHAPELSSRELDAQLRKAWLLSARFTCTQLASGFLMRASRAGLSSFSLDDLADDLYHLAVTLSEAGRYVDQQLLQSGGARKRAAGFLKYAARHGLVRRAGPHTWTPTVTETILNVRPKEVGFDQAPLMYAWNELQEMLRNE